MRGRISIIAPLTLGACLAAPAYAQTVAQQGSETSPAAQGSTGSTTALTEIVVTAQRRSESMQKVPISVHATTAADLATHGLNDSLGLAMDVKGNVFIATAQIIVSSRSLTGRRLSWRGPA